VHARRTGLLPEEHRPRAFTSRNPFSVGTPLVDGRVVGAWSVTGGQIVLDAYERLSASDARAVERERAALEAFHA
ncbi:MAG TPA: crosslink repair DNA glycosylase YcaQ family protein, partial [Candidatus Limnocylindrales bacterium]|nr:crosslink repair DNA glycosylase YcaQ family protein [Candidatus Limnocylindrales bacterium]